MDERDERKRTSGDASKRFKTASELELHHCSRKSVAGTYLLATRCPVYRRHDSHSGSRTELENLSNDAKGKGTSSEPARPKVPMRRAGADCSVIARKRGNARGAKGAGHRRWERANWQQEEPSFLDGRRRSSCCTASRRKPPRSPASHNLLKPCPSLARWSGSRRRRTRAEPSGGIVYEPANTPQCPECS